MAPDSTCSRIAFAHGLASWYVARDIGAKPSVRWHFTHRDRIIGATSTVQVTCVVLPCACGRDTPAATKVTTAIARAADADCRDRPRENKSTSRNLNIVCAADCRRRIGHFRRCNRPTSVRTASMVHAHLTPIEHTASRLRSLCRYFI